MSETLLTPEQEALARRTAELIIASKRPVLNRDEATRHVGLSESSTFTRWCQRWKVRPCAHGRYSRGQLDRGLDRESRAYPNRRKAA